MTDVQSGTPERSEKAQRLRLRFARGPEAEVLWTYCHPYDFDSGDAFFRFKGASWATSALLWLNRRGTFEKMRLLLDPGGNGIYARPLAAQVRAGRFDDAPVFDPGAIQG